MHEQSTEQGVRSAQIVGHRVRARERLSRAILDTLPSATAVISHDGVIEAVNAAWVLEAAESTSRFPGPGDDWVALMAHVPEVAAGARAVLAGSVSSTSYELEEDGRWIELHIALFPEGPTRGALLTRSDVTARVEEKRVLQRLHEQAETRLLEGGRLLELVATNAPLSTVLDEVTAFGARQLPGSDWLVVAGSQSDVHHGASAGLAPASVARAVERYRTLAPLAGPAAEITRLDHFLTGHGIVLASDGRSGWVRPIPAGDPDQGVAAVIILLPAHDHDEPTARELLEQASAIVRIVLERERSARQLAAYALTDRLDQLGPIDEGSVTATAELDEVLAVLTHELSTPLTVISGYTEMLQDRLAGGEPRTLTGVAAIERNVQNLSRLVTALADARGPGAAGEATVTADLAAFTRGVLDDLAPLFDVHPLTADICLEPAPADIDPIGLRQVLTNLLGNASKFSDAGSPIEVVVGRDGTQVRICVVDHGPGVPPDRVHALFGRFARLGSSRRGLGLGLYLSRAIAWRLDGDIVYAPTPGGGASFVLTLPLAPEEP